MSDLELDSRRGTGLRKPKDLTVSDMIQKNSLAGLESEPGDLRAYLIKRTMARHGFSKKQASALIRAFGG